MEVYVFKYKLVIVDVEKSLQFHELSNMSSKR